jgi:hypothetical protein
VHQLDYDLAEAMHTGCALLRSDESIHREAIKHDFHECPTKHMQIKQAQIVLKRLDVRGHVFTVERLEAALRTFKLNPLDEEGIPEYAQLLWDEMHGYIA